MAETHPAGVLQDGPKPAVDRSGILHRGASGTCSNRIECGVPGRHTLEGVEEVVDVEDTVLKLAGG